MFIKNFSDINKSHMYKCEDNEIYDFLYNIKQIHPICFEIQDGNKIYSFYRNAKLKKALDEFRTSFKEVNNE